MADIPLYFQKQNKTLDYPIWVVKILQKKGPVRELGSEGHDSSCGLETICLSPEHCASQCVGLHKIWTHYSGPIALYIDSITNDLVSNSGFPKPSMAITQILGARKV